MEVKVRPVEDPDPSESLSKDSSGSLSGMRTTRLLAATRIVTTVALSAALTLIAALSSLSTAHAQTPTPTPFPSMDLTVVKSDSIDPVIAGGHLVYTLTVTRSGIYGGQAVTLTDSLPPAATFIGASSTHGTCNKSGGMLTCALGSLSPELTATITVEITAPGSGGTISNSASVSAFNTFDLNPADNNATETTMVFTADEIPDTTWWALSLLAIMLGALAYLTLGRRSPSTAG